MTGQSAEFIPAQEVEFIPTLPDEKDVKPVLEGNIDVSKLQAFPNEDGTFKSLESLSVPIPDDPDGHVVLIPGVDPKTGKSLSVQEAKALFDETGKHLGVFSSTGEATVFSKKLSKGQESLIPKFGTEKVDADGVRIVNKGQDPQEQELRLLQKQAKRLEQERIDKKALESIRSRPDELNQQQIDGALNNVVTFTELDRAASPVPVSNSDIAVNMKQTPQVEFIPNENFDNKARDLLPTTLRIAGFGDTGIELSPKVAAFLVATGGRMLGSIRGIKQFFSDDPEIETENERLLEELTKDPVVGNAAIGGDITGALADPLLWLLPVGKAKSVFGAAKRGLVAGGLIGAANPVREGESRFENSVRTAILSAVFFPLVGKVGAKFSKKKFPLFDEPEKVLPKVEPNIKPKLLTQTASTQQGETIVVNRSGKAGTRVELAKEKLDIEDVAFQERIKGKPKGLPAPTSTQKGETIIADKTGKRVGTRAQQIAQKNADDEAAFLERTARQEADPQAVPAEIVAKELSTTSHPNATAVRNFMAKGGSAGAEKEKTITELIKQRRLNNLSTGNAQVELLSDIAGTAVGAATGFATAEEDASLEEKGARTLMGGLAGYTLVRTGKNIFGRLSSKKVSKSIGGGVQAAEKEVKVVGDVAEPIFTTRLSPKINKAVTDLAADFFKSNPGLRDPSRLISDDIQRYVAGNVVPKEMLAKHGITNKQFAEIWRAEITEHARALGQLSQVYRQALKKMTPEELGAIRAGGLEGDPSDYVRPFWKRLTDAWRAALVTQPATAVRNAVTQAGRIGLDVIQAPIDHWLQRLSGRPVTVQPFDGLEQAMSLFQRNKSIANKVLDAFPTQKNRLFQNYLSDVSTNMNVPMQNKFWDGIQKGIDVANVLNRGQEFIIRRAIFQSVLNQELRKQGKNLRHIIKNNQLGEIPEEMVKKATERALNRTFATTPGRNTIARQLIDTINRVPGFSLAFPFPRFMYNALKFQYEFSPFGVLSYLSKKEFSALMAGDTSRISKAIIGSAMLGAAFEARNHKDAGEKWYEWNTDDGVIDMRPFNPFASYLFTAEIMKRYKNGTLDQLSMGDIAQGLLSTNLRAGTGLFLLDNAFNLITKSADLDKFKQKGGEFIGQAAAGLFTPMVFFRDAYDQFTLGKSIIRDTSQNPLTDNIKNKFPVLSQELPEKEQVTREGPQYFNDPLKRQFTGISERGPKNSAEKELDRLGFERREILTRTGDKVVDKLTASLMGPAIEYIIGDVVENSASYKQMTDAQKGVFLAEEIGEIRKEVREIAEEQISLRRGIELKISRSTRRERLLLEEFGIRELADELLGPLNDDELK